jgi:hypothetical protein
MPMRKSFLARARLPLKHSLSTIRRLPPAWPPSPPRWAILMTGLAAERALFDKLVQSPESAALRHAFFAERAAAKIAGVTADTAVRPIRSAAVIGAGTMGAESR